MRQSLRLLAALTAFYASAGVASGQVQGFDGPGIKIGEGLVLHPGASVEVVEDTNIFYQSSSENPIQSPILRIRAGLSLATRPPQRLPGAATTPRKVEFRIGAAAAYREYLMGSDAVRGQRNVDVEAGVGLTVGPNAPFSFGVFDDFLRSARPPNQESSSSWVRDFNRGGVSFTFRPGGGALELKLRYTNEIEAWESGPLDLLVSHVGDVMLKWRMLPKTALVFEGSGGYSARGANHPKSYPLRLYVGLFGQLTYQTSVILRAGYANGFYEGGSSYNNAVGQAQLDWRPLETALVSVGFEHNFRDSLWSSLYVDEHAYVRYSHQIAGRLALRLATGYRYRQYDGVPTNPAIVRTEGTANAHLLEVDVGADYRVAKMVVLGVGYQLDAALTDYAITFLQGGRPVRDAWDWIKHQAMAKVEVSY